MKWPQEWRDEEDYRGRYFNTAHEFVARYLQAPWRKKAVACVRKVIEEFRAEAIKNEEPPSLPSYDQLHERLEAADLFEVASQLSENDGYNGVSLGGALLAEAVGGVFCNRPSVARWKKVGEIIENDPVALMVLVRLVQQRTKKRPRLQDEVRTVASKLVRQYVDNPIESVHPRDASMVTEMRRQWDAKPDLKEIWFGLRSNQNVMPFRSDWHIFDLLFKVDATFAAALIEEYKAPFQPAMIFAYGSFEPHRRFAQWEQLMQDALPAFEENGAWNDGILLPMLLQMAQEAIHSSFVRPDESKEAIERHDSQLSELTEKIATIVWRRPDGNAATLCWSAWLFRSVMSALDGERVPYPQDGRSRARPAWQMVHALVRPDKSVAWTNLRPTDVASEDILCGVAVRILAAQKHDLAVPGRDLLFEMLPSEPEQFLEGTEGNYMRELPSLFVIWGKRADSFGARVLAAALFDEDVAVTFAKLWHRTLVLREIVEHRHAFHSDDNKYDDSARRAAETIHFVISLGINLVDYVQDERQDIKFADRRNTTRTLFSTLHDATREMIAIDPIGLRNLEEAHNHLCVRRLVYEASQTSDTKSAALLSKVDFPTAGDLLFERSGVSRSFFECLQMLLANGITRAQIVEALAGVDINLDQLAEQAKRLNAIEYKRTIDLTGLEA